MGIGFRHLCTSSKLKLGVYVWKLPHYSTLLTDNPPHIYVSFNPQPSSHMCLITQPSSHTTFIGTRTLCTPLTLTCDTLQRSHQHIVRACFLLPLGDACAREKLRVSGSRYSQLFPRFPSRIYRSRYPQIFPRAFIAER